MVRYSEDPAVQVEARISAPPAVVWPLVSDITLPARFSTELVAAEWIDGGGGPAPGLVSPAVTTMTRSGPGR